MKGQRQVLWLFIGSISIVSIVVGVLSAWLIWDIFHLVATSYNKSLMVAVGSRLMIKSWVTLGTLVVVAIILSVVVGLWAVRRLMQPYWAILESFSHLAKNRFAAISLDGFDQDEQRLMVEYQHVLQRDYDRLKTLESIKGWKEGAQLLLHEIKNPLTPLRLSADALAMSETAPLATVKSIQTAVTDIDNILNAFRELSSLDFTETHPIQMADFWSDTVSGLSQLFPNLRVEGTPPRVGIQSEPTLLRMVLFNLIRNGIEASSNFYVRFPDDEFGVIYFVTPGQTISDPEAIFNFGVSTKGSGRGYGLYICHQICRYLGHSLWVENTPDAVQFVVKAEIL